MGEGAGVGTDLDRPHRRQNLLTGEWVLVSPHRTERPWQGREEDPAPDARPEHDPGCYLCPGNRRAGGRSNPEYTGVFVFDNDFPALVPEAARSEGAAAGMLRARAETGICRVVCFSPRHDLTLAGMSPAGVRAVVDAWTEQYRELGARSSINHVQIFENRGAMMGASNPHPHGQIWAQRSIPLEVARETERQSAHFAAEGRSLLADYLALEREAGDRLVLENQHFTALVPFWAVWPFETLVISRAHRRSLLDLTADERQGLAELLRRLTARYDQLFRTTFPYSAGIHQAPTDGADHEAWHLHLHFYPPLLRSATVRKFMVGYEMLGEPQRDLTAETAAARLRALPDARGPTDGKGPPASGDGEPRGGAA